MKIINLKGTVPLREQHNPRAGGPQYISIDSITLAMDRHVLPAPV